MDTSLDSFTDLFEEYIIENHFNDLIDVMKKDDTEIHYGIVINFIILFEKCLTLGHGILSNAIALVPKLDQKLVSAQRVILSRIPEDDKQGLVVKTKVHVRMTGLPLCPELHRTSFPRNRDVGSFLRVSGTVTRITAPKMLEYKREYLCSKCKKVFHVQAEYEQYYSLKPPLKCLNPEGCPGTNFAPVKMIDQFNYKDYQEVKIQEQVSKLSVGTVPQSMWATLEDDLVDSCKPGDDVVICGTVMRRWKPNSVVGSRGEIEVCLRVSHLSVSNDQKTWVLVTNETISHFQQFWNDHSSNPLKARDLIIASICPQVFGLYLVKLAVAIILAGGVGKQESMSCRIRGEPHLLLVGDPGTGKSHIIRFASKICSRSVHTTGIGSTSAGLTVSAVHEHGEWQLEAGALVLADGGICCIDEFNSIREHDRTTIHEAMEQQTISVAKAGVVCKLNTRCSIIAATNPKGHYDPNIPLSVNIAVASPLLSRFDLVLILLDSRNENWDRIVSEFILQGKEAFKENQNTSLWSAEKLQEYFCVIKTLNPKLTSDANTILCSYYQAQRRADCRNAARTTVRLLESLIRLSQGHARIMFREEVSVQDAVIAISLVESSMVGTTLIGEVDTLHTTFPSDPLLEYKKQARIILEKLGLNDLLRKELQLMDEIRNNASQPPTEFDKNIEHPPRAPVVASEKLTKILNNIRKNKERTIFDSLRHQRPTKKPKLPSKLDKSIDKGKSGLLDISDSDPDDPPSKELVESSKPKSKKSTKNMSKETNLSVFLNISDSDPDDPSPEENARSSKSRSILTKNTRKESNLSALLDISNSDPDDPPPLENRKPPKPISKKSTKNEIKETNHLILHNILDSDRNDSISNEKKKSIGQKSKKSKHFKRKHDVIDSSDDSDLNTENFNDADNDLFKSVFTSQKSNCTEASNNQDVPLFSDFVAARRSSMDELFDDESNDIDFSLCKHNNASEESTGYDNKSVNNNSSSKVEHTAGPSGVNKFIQVKSKRVSDDNKERPQDKIINAFGSEFGSFEKPDSNYQKVSIEKPSSESGIKTRPTKISPATLSKLQKFSFASHKKNESEAISTLPQNSNDENVNTDCLLDISAEISTVESLQSSRIVTQTQNTQSKNPFVFSMFNDDDIDILDDI